MTCPRSVSASQQAREALVASLRQQVGALAAPAGEPEEVLSSGCPPLDALLPRRGWERGALVEWLAEHPGSGAGTLAWVAAREAARAGGMVVVIDRRGEFYPPAAVAWGVECGQLLVVRPRDAAEELWALDQALRSPAVAAVWAPLGRLDSRQYRRLQLAAEEGRTLGLFVRSTRYRGEPTWADVQLVVEPIGRSHVPRETFLTRSMRTTVRQLRVVVARCPGGAAERGVELQVEDFTAAITAARTTATKIHRENYRAGDFSQPDGSRPENTPDVFSGRRIGTSHETPARPPLSAVGFTTGYRRSPGA